MTDIRPTADPSVAAPAPFGGGVRIALWSCAVAAVVAAGLVLWNATGPAIFTDMVSAAIAWCF